MRYYYQDPKLDKKEKKELLEKLTALEKTILKRAKTGADTMSIIGVCKPYTNKWGGREFASTDEILKVIKKLCKMELLVRR